MISTLLLCARISFIVVAITLFGLRFFLLQISQVNWSILRDATLSSVYVDVYTKIDEPQTGNHDEVCLRKSLQSVAVDCTKYGCRYNWDECLECPDKWKDLANFIWLNCLGDHASNDCIGAGFQASYESTQVDHPSMCCHRQNNHVNEAASKIHHDDCWVPKLQLFWQQGDKSVLC